jgi:hypothetical protein
MKLGEIYSWETHQALGHGVRKKYHIFICEEDAQGEHTFLFVSSADYFKVSKNDYAFLAYDSYISLGRPIYYTTADLNGYNKTLVGQLSEVHLQQLFNAVQGSEQMEGKDIKRVCNALKSVM